MRFLKYLIFLIPFLFFSCTSQKKIYIEIENCVNGKIQKNSSMLLNPVAKISFFDSIAKMEKLLVKNNVLKDSSKKGYASLISRIANKTDFSSEYLDLKNSFQLFAFINEDISTSQIMYDFCPREVLKENYDNKKLIGWIKIYEDVFFEGYPTTSILERMFNQIDFKSRYERLSFCNLVYLYLYAEYEPPLYPKDQIYQNDSDKN